MAFKIVIILAAIAAVKAGYLGSPALSYSSSAIAASPLAYGAAPVIGLQHAAPAVSSSYLRKSAIKAVAPVATTYAAAPALSYGATLGGYSGYGYSGLSTGYGLGGYSTGLSAGYGIHNAAVSSSYLRKSSIKAVAPVATTYAAAPVATTYAAAPALSYGTTLGGYSGLRTAYGLGGSYGYSAGLRSGYGLAGSGYGYGAGYGYSGYSSPALAYSTGLGHAW